MTADSSKSVLCSVVLGLAGACAHTSAAEHEDPATAADAGPGQDRPSASARDAAVRGLDATQPSAADAGASARDAGRSLNAARASGPSAGCGKPAAGDDAFDDRTRRVGSSERTYHVRVPASYDEDRTYALIFRLHGTGGDGLSGGLGIEYAAGQDAIVVGPDGLNGSWTRSSESSDLQLFDAIYDELTAQYCVDLGRVYAYGFSAGGGLANALGCKRASLLRGTAAIAGVDRADDSCKSAPMAAWFKHDADDPSVPVAQGKSARDRALIRNGCSAGTMMDDDGCLQYEGCQTEEPVVWCETRGRGHDIAGDMAPAQVWRFFSSLASAEE